MELDQNFDEENDILFLKNEKFQQTMNSNNYFTNSSNKSIGFNYRYNDNEDTNFEQEEQNKK